MPTFKKEVELRGAHVSRVFFCSGLFSCGGDIMVIKVGAVSCDPDHVAKYEDYSWLVSNTNFTVLPGGTDAWCRSLAEIAVPQQLSVFVPVIYSRKPRWTSLGGASLL